MSSLMLSCVGGSDGMEGVQEWVILAALVGTGCDVINPDYR